MRPSRLLAVAWRDLRLVASGKGWYKLPLLAFGLLLPAGALPLRTPELPTPVAAARGDIPEALRGLIQERPRAQVTLRDGDPIVVVAPWVPEATRAALNTLPGEPVVVMEKRDTPTPKPARSLLLALLSLSLLTGPLAESLPGERARGTLDALRAAAISRAELVGGKWLAWAGTCSAFTLSVAGLGALTGAQAPGLWMAGLPMVAAMAVALGLWLGRDAGDEIDGAARTMRVVPAVALVLAAVAFLLALSHPLLAGLVPLGGAILLSGDMLAGPGPVLSALLGTAIGCGALLAHTTRSLERMIPIGPSRWRPILGMVGAAAAAWWLPSIGPAMWALAGNPDLGASLEVGAGLAAGGGMLAGLAAVAALRAHVPLGRPRLGGVPRGVALGAALAMAAGLSAWTSFGGDGVEAMRLRSLAAQAPGWAGIPVATLVALGHEALFRGWMQRRFGPWVAGIAWVVVASPFAPVRGALVAASLGLISHRLGWVAALAAHLTWALLAPWLSMTSLWATLAAAGVALLIAGLPHAAPNGQARSPAP